MAYFNNFQPNGQRHGQPGQMNFQQGQAPPPIRNRNSACNFRGRRPRMQQNYTAFPRGNWNCPPPPPPVPPPSFNGPPPPFTVPPPPLPGASQSGFNGMNNKRPVNNVWSDPNFHQLPQGKSCYGSGPQGHGQRGRGFGRGGGGRGRGRGGNYQRGGHHHHNNPNSRGNNSNRNDQSNSNGMNNSHGNNLNGGKKKEKIDKRDLPENNVYRCETCDRGFKTEEKFKQHTDEHTKCTVPGCRYVAAPKLVQFHYQTQHLTGLATKIWSTQSPEDVKKWIEERKRNFPTKENIARKLREAEERRQRGEVVETKNYGKMRGRGRGRRGQFRKWNHWQDRSRQHEDHVPGTSQSVENMESHDSTVGTKRPPGTENVNGKEESSSVNGLSCPSPKKRKIENNGDNRDEKDSESKDPLSLVMKDSEDSSDDSSDEEAKPQVLQGHGLTSLISSYDSNSEKEGEEIAEETPKPTTPEPVPSPSPSNQPQKGDNSAKSKPKRRCQPPPRFPKRNRHPRNLLIQNSLLEMLLAKDIRHERNVLLQCVHHIVKNKYFGIVDGKTQTVGK